MAEIGSREWNNQMYHVHATPYGGIAGMIEKRRIAAIINTIKRDNKSGDCTLLEVGCEAGYLLQACEKALPGYKIWGLDISDDSLEEARKKLSEEAQFIRHDITEPLPLDQKFDYILCSETLEHVPNYEAAVENIAQLASHDTTLIFTVPLEKLKNQLKRFLIRTGVFNLLFKGIEEGFSEWHVNDFSAEQFKQLIGSHFELISYRNILQMHQLIVAKPKNNQP